MQSSTTSSDPVRVLIVDDHESMLARAAAVLTPSCMVVGAVTNGPAAIEAAAALCPDVIVLDISMPGMNGFELASKLRCSGSKAALVFLTVHDEEAFVKAAMAAGASGYVLKARLASDLTMAVRDARAGRPFISKIR
jgi:DNA-binding NarL/FixJ family response regulator